MALSDLSPKDVFRLYTAIGEARGTNTVIIPPRAEMLAAIRAAVESEGDLGKNVVPVLAEPVRRAVALVRSILVRRHGTAYTEDLWTRLTRKPL